MRNSFQTSFLIIALIMATFVPIYDVKAGDIPLNDYVHEITITSTHATLGDFATITIPQNVTYKGQKWDKVLKKGMEVTIFAGYEGYNMNKEFQGKISRINPDIPITIECEDIADLKTNRFSKSWQNVNLKELIAHISGTIPNEARDIKVGKFLIQNETPARVLQVLREQYGLPSWLRDGKLYVGAKYYDKGNTLTVEAWKREGTQLEYRFKEDIKMLVKAVSILPDNKKLEAEAGEVGGDTRTYPYAGITDKVELKKLAEAQLAKIKLEGFTGSVATLGLPFSRHGDIISIVDKEYNGSRSGKYFIDKVQVNLGQQGFSRINTIGDRATT
jgi:PII-like signaling protein